MIARAAQEASLFSFASWSSNRNGLGIRPECRQNVHAMCLEPETVRAWHEEATLLNKAGMILWQRCIDPVDRFMVEKEFRQYHEALILGAVAKAEEWLDHLCEKVPDGEGGDFRLRVASGSPSLDIEVTELLDGQRLRDREYRRSYREAKLNPKKPLRVGEVHPDDADETDVFERPDVDRLIGQKTKKKRECRYPEHTGLAIYDNVTSLFDDTAEGVPGVTQEQIREAVAKHKSAEEFSGIWVVDGAYRVVRISPA